MNKIYMIGDTHFGHANIIKYCNRPFKDTDEMDKALIRNWNSVVKQSDKVIMFGDFAFKNTGAVAAILAQLNGYKILIMGNHDGLSVAKYLEYGFNEVTRYPIIIDGFFICSHEPMFVQPDGPFANIFAHVHNNPGYIPVSSRTFCVSAELINYTPIDFEVIKSKMEACENGTQKKETEGKDLA